MACADDDSPRQSPCCHGVALYTYHLFDKTYLLSRVIFLNFSSIQLHLGLPTREWQVKRLGNEGGLPSLEGAREGRS